jgi:hypothetical protein
MLKPQFSGKEPMHKGSSAARIVTVLRVLFVPEGGQTMSEVRYKNELHRVAISAAATLWTDSRLGRRLGFYQCADRRGFVTIS